MEITLSFLGDIPVFHLLGRLDVNTSPLLEDRLLPLLSVHAQRMIFDCAELTYVSSAGLRVFLSTQRTLTTQEGGVVFAALTEPVRELFHLAGLDNIFVIVSTLPEAISKLHLLL